jgi:hypothetical protein
LSKEEVAKKIKAVRRQLQEKFARNPNALTVK